MISLKITRPVIVLRQQPLVLRWRILQISVTDLYLAQRTRKTLKFAKCYSYIRGCHIVPMGHVRHIFDFKFSIYCKCQLKLWFLFCFLNSNFRKERFFLLNINFWVTKWLDETQPRMSHVTYFQVWFSRWFSTEIVVLYFFDTISLKCP